MFRANAFYSHNIVTSKLLQRTKHIKYTFNAYEGKYHTYEKYHHHAQRYSLIVVS